jgi:hypothetical protein
MCYAAEIVNSLTPKAIGPHYGQPPDMCTAAKWCTRMGLNQGVMSIKMGAVAP